MFWQNFKSFWRAVSMDCHGAARAQSESFDHSLSTSQRAGLWVHLRLCKMCCRYKDQIQFLREASQKHSENMTESQSGALPGPARDRIKRRLADEAKLPNSNP